MTIDEIPQRSSMALLAAIMRLASIDGAGPFTEADRFEKYWGLQWPLFL